MPVPRLVATDLDGTLLTSRGTVTPRSVAALARLQRLHGTRVLLASGRSPRSVQKVIDLFAGGLVPDSVICCNGALAFDPSTREISLPQFLVLEAAVNCVRGIRAAVAASGGGIAAFACEVVYIGAGVEEYSNDTFFVCDAEWKRIRASAIYYKHTVLDSGELMESFLETLYSAEGGQRGAIIKLLALDESRPAPRLYESLPPELKAEPHGSDPATQFSVVYSGEYFLEISAANVSKGLALAAYCAKHGIDRADVVAFGDLINDVEMLKFAGTGLCMRNGHEEVKKLADRVIGFNDDDGVAQEIESWFADSA
ncbi:hypothetical protein HDU84_000649 [Entophlyctis sp. JEL0112]|nr:hypothetical protein HDU84_000649 [Entophlyctis sp. JEL0112]